jgi:hypothetical protein
VQPAAGIFLDREMKKRALFGPFWSYIKLISGMVAPAENGSE